MSHDIASKAINSFNVINWHYRCEISFLTLLALEKVGTDNVVRLNELAFEAVFVNEAFADTPDKIEIRDRINAHPRCASILTYEVIA